MQTAHVRPALRALYLRRFWYSVVAGVTTTFHYLSSVAIVVLSTTVATRPWFLGPWTENRISTYLYFVAALTALTTLVPWRRFAIAFRKAHEMLVDVMSLFLAGEVTIQEMFAVAQEAKRIIINATEGAG